MHKELHVKPDRLGTLLPVNTATSDQQGIKWSLHSVHSEADEDKKSGQPINAKCGWICWVKACGLTNCELRSTHGTGVCSLPPPFSFLWFYTTNYTHTLCPAVLCKSNLAHTELHAYTSFLLTGLKVYTGFLVMQLCSDVGWHGVNLVPEDPSGIKKRAKTTLWGMFSILFALHNGVIETIGGEKPYAFLGFMIMSDKNIGRDLNCYENFPRKLVFSKKFPQKCLPFSQSSDIGDKIFGQYQWYIWRSCLKMLSAVKYMWMNSSQSKV